MNNISVKTYKSPYGELIIGSYENQLCLCDWKFRAQRDRIDKRIQTSLKSSYKEEHSEIVELAIIQLKEYFSKNRTDFDIPLLTNGTEFQKRVWDELVNIPFGKTMSYLSLSHRLGNPKAIRAVASANGANALSIIIPCHRIIGTNGEMTGYAGGLKAKKDLLALEGYKGNNNQLDIF